ncbi:MAG: PLP-dependent aminotransferase family protein, partial [Filifactor alocis]
TGADAGLHVVLQYPKYFTEKDIVAEALKQKIAVYGLESYGKKQEYPSILLGFATLTNEEITEGISLLKAISYHSTVPSP